MADEQTPLFNAGTAIIGELVASMHKYNRVATGTTINAIRMQVDGNERLRIYGPGQLIALEKGRKPTSASGPFPRYGGLSFVESIKAWVAAKGIEAAAWYPIYRHINKVGFAGTPGLLTKPLAPENLVKVMSKELKQLNRLYATQVLKSIFKK